MDDNRGAGRWADWRSIVALTGIGGIELGWGMSRGQVRYTLTRPGHNGVLMICVQDVETIGARVLRHLRIVPDAR